MKVDPMPTASHDVPDVAIAPNTSSLSTLEAPVLMDSSPIIEPVIQTPYETPPPGATEEPSLQSRNATLWGFSRAPIENEKYVAETSTPTDPETPAPILSPAGEEPQLSVSSTETETKTETATSAQTPSGGELVPSGEDSLPRDNPTSLATSEIPGMGPQDRLGVIAIPKCGTTSISAALATKHPFVEHLNPCVPGYPLLHARNFDPTRRPSYKGAGTGCAHADLSDRCRTCRALDFMHLQHSRHDELVIAFKRVAPKRHAPGKLRLVTMLRNPLSRICSEYDFAQLSEVKTLGLSRWRGRYWGMKDYPDSFLWSYSRMPMQRHILQKFPAHNRMTRFIAGLSSQRMVTQPFVDLAKRRLGQLDCVFTLEGCGVDALLRCMHRRVVGTAKFSEENYTVDQLSDASAEIFYPGQNFAKASHAAWAGKNKFTGACATAIKTNDKFAKALARMNWADVQLYQAAKELEAARGCD
eukprot:CAMPEP_0118921960 /NCGR_PEP_ID=MMETSP1169-20130426/1064_1 /TAXON_ID=36882 /ORGANISM="Pyramimonas obovata, Strain CCMP722" /LENGTH=470 /DNA_ID=CAMNT_0006862767 /DNA_START=355 /DNA_END=1767 /DNA_ORIENTATION=-